MKKLGLFLLTLSISICYSADSLSAKPYLPNPEGYPHCNRRPDPPGTRPAPVPVPEPERPNEAPPWMPDPDTGTQSCGCGEFHGLNGNPFRDLNGDPIEVVEQECKREGRPRCRESNRPKIEIRRCLWHPQEKNCILVRASDMANGACFYRDNAGGCRPDRETFTVRTHTSCAPCFRWSSHSEGYVDCRASVETVDTGIPIECEEIPGLPGKDGYQIEKDCNSSCDGTCVLMKTPASECGKDNPVQTMLGFSRCENLDTQGDDNPVVSWD